MTPGLALGPEPSLAREDPQSLCPPSHSSGLTQLALPTGALGGSALRPTRTLTQDNHGGGGWVEVWTGHHKPEQQLPPRACYGTGQPKVERALSWLPGRAQKVVENPKALLPQAWWDTGCGYWLLLPGAATWPAYAHGHTYRAMHGVRSITAQDIDNTELQAAVQEIGQDSQGRGERLSKATRKLPGSNENMSFRLKAAGEQELKICNRNGGLSGGGWGGRRSGAQSCWGWRGR